MYESYWGLESAPFEAVPDPRMMVLAGPHEDALLLLHHFFARREGVALLTGAPGTGKTSVIRRLFGLLGDDLLGCHLSEGADSPVRLRTRILAQIRRDPSDVDLDGRLSELWSRGQKVVVALDAAGTGDFGGTLAEIRALVQGHRALCVLVTGPESIASRFAMEFDEPEVGARLRLTPLDGGEVARLIAHRLRTSGYSREELPFTEDAIAEIDRLTGGVPRAVVQTADAALLYGMSEGLPRLDRAALRAMTLDTTFATGETPRLAA